jgi:chromosome segregation ATPase
MSLHELRLGEEDELQLRMSKVGAFSMKLGEGDGDSGEGSDLSLDLPDSFEEDMDVPVVSAPSPKPPSPRKAVKGGSSSSESKEVASLYSMLSSRDFADFITSQTNLTKLRKKRESDLTMREVVCLRASEVCVPLDREREMLEQKYAAEVETRKSLTAALDVRDKEITRALQADKSAEYVSEGYKAEVSVLTERLARLTAVIDEQQDLDKITKKKAATADALEKENERLARERDRLQKNFDKQSAVLSALTDSEKSARIGRADAEKARELLVLDKSFLTKELREASAKANDYGRRNEELASRALALDSKVGSLTDQLLSVQLKSRSDADDRLEGEVRKLREEAAATTEGLRAATAQQAERETRVLREAKNSAESELEHCRRNLTRVSHEAADSMREHLGAMASKEAELTETRGELKVRNFEAASMRARAEEADSRVRQLHAELDLLREQIGLHQATVHRLESEMAINEQVLKSDLERAMERLRAYEALEESVDREVLRAASGMDGDATAVLKQVEGLPVNPQRRIRQAVQLATQLAQSRGELDKLRAKATGLEGERDAAKEDAEAQKRALSRISAPQTYLVGKLAEEEGLRMAMGKDLKGIQGEMRDCQAALRESEDEVDALREQLAGLLAQRGEAEQLRGYLDILRTQQEQVEEEEEDDDYAGEGDADNDTYGEEVYEDDEEEDDEGGDTVPAMDASRLASTTHMQDYTQAFEDEYSGFPAQEQEQEQEGTVEPEQRSVSFMDVPPELRERMTTLDASGVGSSPGDANMSQASGSKSPGWHKRVVLE